MNQKKKTSMWPVLLGSLLLAASAQVQAQFTYTTNADGMSATITGYSGLGGDVTIPTNINGLTVTTVGSNAFFACDSLTNVTIPGSVTNLDSLAFYFCTNLSSVTISNGVTSIRMRAFALCEGLTTISIPSSLTTIGEEAFLECLSLTNVTIPASCTNIGYLAFAACTSLTSVTVPGSLGDGYEFFQVFESYPTNATIANGVTSIESYVFSGTSLTSVTIPASVTNIGEGAFEQCEELTTITMPNGLTSIGADAFEYCSSLISVTIPASVTNIGAYAFYYMVDLTSVFFSGNAPAFGSPLINGDNRTVYYLPGTSGWSNTFAGVPAVLWNPQIQASGASFGVSNNQFGFNITGTANIRIVVEACTNLASPVWTPLQTLTLTNGLYYFSEPLQINAGGRFYRIGSP
jgi:hypothetical protein